MPFRRSVLSITASSETFDVSQEGKKVLVFLTGAANVTISRLPRAFHAPYCKIRIGLDWIRLDWIGLDWTGLDWICLTRDWTCKSEDAL